MSVSTSCPFPCPCLWSCPFPFLWPVHLHVHIHTHICTCTVLRLAHVKVHIQVHVHVHLYRHIYAYTFLHVRVHVHVRIHAKFCMFYEMLAHFRRFTIRFRNFHSRGLLLDPLLAVLHYLFSDFHDLSFFLATKPKQTCTKTRFLFEIYHSYSIANFGIFFRDPRMSTVRRKTSLENWWLKVKYSIVQECKLERETVGKKDWVHSKEGL